MIKKLSIASDVRRQLAEKSQTKCFFDIGLKEENQKLGRIVFELYDGIVPRTCANFAAFCRGINGFSYKYVNVGGKERERKIFETKILRLYIMIVLAEFLVKHV